VRSTIAVDAVLTGRVASVREFGAFVDLGGGVQGLLHVSEMSWSRVTDPSQVVKPGEQITVKVLRVEDDGRKISLGLKQLADDPWATVAERYQPGQVCRGRVTRVAPFGVFVELEPGIQGLLPSSEAGLPHGADLKKVFAPGSDVDVVVLEVDADGRRIRLSSQAVSRLEEADEARAYAERHGDTQAEAFGSLADKLRGALKRGN
jgi:ribosomal protein S1